MGNGSCGEFITCCLCRCFLLRGRTPHTLPLLQCGAPPMGDNSPLFLQCESFPRAAVLHKLLQRGSLPQGAVLQEQAAPAWVPHGVTSPARKPVLAWAPLSTGPQDLPGACSSMGLLQAWGPPRTVGDSLPHHGLLHRLQGNFCSGT